jgi:hypothetical protein
MITALDSIEAAQNRLIDAAELSSLVRGFSDDWERVRDLGAVVRERWREVDGALRRIVSSSPYTQDGRGLDLREFAFGDDLADAMHKLGFSEKHFLLSKGQVFKDVAATSLNCGFPLLFGLLPFFASHKLSRSWTSLGIPRYAHLIPNGTCVFDRRQRGLNMAPIILP